MTISFICSRWSAGKMNKLGSVKFFSPRSSPTNRRKDRNLSSSLSRSLLLLFYLPFTSTYLISFHTILYRPIPYHTIPYHTIKFLAEIIRFDSFLYKLNVISMGIEEILYYIDKYLPMRYQGVVRLSWCTDCDR